MLSLMPSPANLACSLDAALQRRLGTVDACRPMSATGVGVKDLAVLYQRLAAVVARLADFLLTAGPTRRDLNPEPLSCRRSCPIGRIRLLTWAKSRLALQRLTALVGVSCARRVPDDLASDARRLSSAGLHDPDDLLGAGRRGLTTQVGGRHLQAVRRERPQNGSLRHAESLADRVGVQDPTVNGDKVLPGRPIRYQLCLPVELSCKLPDVLIGKPAKRGAIEAVLLIFVRHLGDLMQQLPSLTGCCL
jgi:hypothetical protein